MTDKHIIDTLIEERAPKSSSSAFWPILRPILNMILGYSKAVKMANIIAPLNGQAAINYVSNLLHLHSRFEGFENLPRSGAVIVVCNHPTGIADGIALFDVLSKFRKDIKFYANADAMRICPKFGDAIIPVEWVYEKRTHEKTKQTLVQTIETLKNGEVLAIFPAGRLARMIDGKIQDPEWQASFVMLARKYEVPILPVTMKGPNSFWFHFFARFSQELRDITLFHEFLNKKGKSYKLKAHAVVKPKDLIGNADELCLQIKSQIEDTIIDF